MKRIWRGAAGPLVGTCVLEAWHEKLGTRSATVTIPESVRNGVLQFRRVN